MPGTFKAIYLMAFDLDDRGHAVKAIEARSQASEDAALEEARHLVGRHAGVVVWKREGNPVVGEEGEPFVIFQHGKIGDFN